jgi:hypothetical protein
MLFLAIKFENTSSVIDDKITDDKLIPLTKTSKSAVSLMAVLSSVKSEKNLSQLS